MWASSAWYTALGMFTFFHEQGHAKCSTDWHLLCKYNANAAKCVLKVVLYQYAFASDESCKEMFEVLYVFVCVPAWVCGDYYLLTKLIQISFE